MTPALPHFKYHPNPVRTGAIVKEFITCDRCGEEREYRYTGPVFNEHGNYVRHDPCLCPWCIADGSAAATLHIAFHVPSADYATNTFVSDTTDTDELCRRTPGHDALQYPEWAIHCGDFCAFLDHVDWTDIEHVLPQILDDIEALCGGGDMTETTIWAYKRELSSRGNTAYRGYLFRCLTCGSLRFYADNT